MKKYNEEFHHGLSEGEERIGWIEAGWKTDRI